MPRAKGTRISANPALHFVWHCTVYYTQALYSGVTQITHGGLQIGLSLLDSLISCHQAWEGEQSESPQLLWESGYWPHVTPVSVFS